jgi:hypothetical protein
MTVLPQPQFTSAATEMALFLRRNRKAAVLATGDLPSLEFSVLSQSHERTLPVNP